MRAIYNVRHNIPFVLWCFIFLRHSCILIFPIWICIPTFAFYIIWSFKTFNYWRDLMSLLNVDNESHQLIAILHLIIIHTLGGHEYTNEDKCFPKYIQIFHCPIIMLLFCVIIVFLLVWCAVVLISFAIQ